MRPPSRSDGATGQITVGAGTKLDFETKATYMVTVIATDSFGATASIDVTINVTDVNEGPEIMLGGLAISGVARVDDYAENGTDAVATYMASGPDASMATWTLSGDDAGDFDISSSGELTFKSAPDYEMPMAMGDNNMYMVTVTADDGTNMDTQDVTVTVTNVNEAGEVTLSTEQPRVGTEIMASLTDVDGMLSSVTWQWTSSSDMLAWTDVENGTSNVYTPVDADAGSYLQATAMYTDGHGPDKSEMAESAQQVIANTAPVFAEAMDERSVAENTAAGMYIGAAVAATDAENDPLTYTLGGDDMASFAIDSATGQLMTMAALDFETKTSYSVTVTANDDEEQDTVMVTIMVTNVDEMGTAMLSAMEPSVGTEMMATVTDPDMADMTSVTWQWASSDARDVGYTDIEGATSASYMPVEADVTMYLRATAMYTDGHGPDKSAEAVSENMVRGLAISGMMSVDYAEDSRDAVATYAVSGPDADVATWTHEGADAGAFAISASGELTFMNAPDYEMPADADMDNTYMVTVKATDGTYTAMRDVTVMVTNVDEAGDGDPVGYGAPVLERR